MNKNSNSYQIIYSSVMVLLVGTVLAFIYMALKPKQDENEANDKRKQLLCSIHKVPANDGEIKALFDENIPEGFLVDKEGNKIDTTNRDAAFDVVLNLKKNFKGHDKAKLAVFKSKDGKYIVPAYGAGLWGPIWGYIAIDGNGKNIYGAYFSHEGETPGLGAEIEKPAFQQQFNGKVLYKNGEFKSIAVMKAGQKPTDGADYVDAISGGTITSRGVQAMLEECLKPYDPFFRKLQSETK